MRKEILIDRLQDIIYVSLARDHKTCRINHVDNLLIMVVELEKLIKELSNEVNQK